jgi:hypothetical protein
MTWMSLNRKLLSPILQVGKIGKKQSDHLVETATQNDRIYS